MLFFLPVEQHRHELDDNNGEKEKHQNNTDGLQMKILFCYQDLRIKILLVTLLFRIFLAEQKPVK